MISCLDCLLVQRSLCSTVSFNGLFHSSHVLITSDFRMRKHTYSTHPVWIRVPLSVIEKQIAYSTELKEHTYTHTVTLRVGTQRNAEWQKRTSTNESLHLYMHLTVVHTWYKFKSEPSVWLHTVNKCTHTHAQLIISAVSRRVRPHPEQHNDRLCFYILFPLQRHSEEDKSV